MCVGERTDSDKKGVHCLSLITVIRSQTTTSDINPASTIKILTKYFITIIQERKLIFEYELDTVQGSSNRSSGEFDFFIQDFYDHFYSKQDVPAS